MAPSLLDRLAGRVAAGPLTSNLSLSQLKQSVREDLENLLNTRCRWQSPPEGLEHLQESLINYGVPDFTGASLSSAEDRERFRQAVELTIRAFEPRLASVRLVLLSPSEPEDRVLRFRIEAELRVEPLPEPVVFDSVIEPHSRRILVEKTN